MMAVAPGRLSVLRYLFLSARRPFTLALPIWISVFDAETYRLSALWLVNRLYLSMKVQVGQRDESYIFLICEHVCLTCSAGKYLTA